MTNKRKALDGIEKALKTAAYLENKDCGCGFCKATRRLRRQLAPAKLYLEKQDRRKG